jgi:hypothetical protein
MMPLGTLNRFCWAETVAAEVARMKAARKSDLKNEM